MSVIDERSLPGYWSFFWMFWMQPITLHHQLKDLDLDLDQSGLRLWRQRAENSHVKGVLLRCVFLYTITPLIFVLSLWMVDAGFPLSLNWSKLRLGLAVGLASGLAGGLEGGLALGLAGGLPSGLAVGLALGLVLGLIDGFYVGVGVIAGYSPLFFLSVFRLPSFILESMITICMFLISSQSRPAWTLRNLPFLAHDLIHFPLPFLSQILIQCGKQEPVQTQVVIHRAAASIAQKKAAAQAQFALRNMSLQDAVRTRRYQAVSKLDLAFFSGAEVGDEPWLHFCQAAGELHAGLMGSLHQSRRLHLEDAFRRLNILKNHLIANPAARNNQLFETLDVFLKCCEQEVDLLAKMEAENPQVPSPFITGPVLQKRSALFVGRDSVIHQIDHMLGPDRREPLFLRGQRRMGKSSLLNMLPDRLASGTKVVNLTFQGLTGSAEREARPDAWIVAEVAATLEQQIPETPNWDASFQWLAAQDARLKLENLRLLICVDEVERLQESIDKGHTDTGLLQLIRLCGDQLSQVRFLLATAYTRKVLGPEWSDKLISAREITLAYLDADAAKALISKPQPDFPDIYPPGGVDWIYNQTKGHPYFTQTVCDHLVQFLNAEGRQKAVQADLERAVDDSIDEGGVFGNVWQMLLNEDQRSLLRRAAKGEILPKDRYGRELENLHFVEARDGGYGLIMPMLATWIQLNG